MLDVFLVFAIFASAITANKIALFALSPSLLTTIRMLSASFLLYLFSCFSKKHCPNWSQIGQNLITLIIIALCTTYLNSNLKAFALKYMPSYKAAYFGALDPFITAIMAYFLLSEKLNFRKFVGIIFAFIGALILIASQTSSEIKLQALFFISYPELAALSAIIFSRFGWILIQKYLKKGTYTTVQINIITMLFGGILSLITVYINSGYYISLNNISQVKLLSNFNSSAILLFFLSYTILIGNVIGYNLYSLMLKKYSATFISIAGFSIPLLVALYGWLLLGEQLSYSYFVSCFITFIGLVIFFKEERKGKHSN